MFNPVAKPFVALSAVSRFSLEHEHQSLKSFIYCVCIGT